MKRYAILIFFSVSIFSKANAQRTWIEAEISKEIVKKLEISVSPQLRFREGFDLKEYFFDTNLEYEFSKYFKIGGGYRLGNNISKKDNTKSFGRFNFDLKTGWKWKNFQPKFRIRYTNAEDFDDDYSEPGKFLRFKPEIEYSIKKIKAEPYIAFEWYKNLDTKEFDKVRFESGVNFKISKKHRIGTYYRLHNYLGNDKNSIHILGLSYKLKL